MDKDYKELLEEIKKIIKETEKKFKGFGMVSETVNKAINGEQIKMCSHCHTPNMVIVHNRVLTLIGEHRMWRCLNCGKTWLELRRLK